MNLEGRKVAVVRMHGTIQVHGIGQLGPTLDYQQKGKLQMVLCDRGVFVKATCGAGVPNVPAGTIKEFLVPDEMCSMIEFEGNSETNNRQKTNEPSGN